MAASKDETQQHAGKELYAALKSNKIDVLLDDREDRAGVKFKDMELIGIPVQIVIGKGLAEGNVEVGLRGMSRDNVPLSDAATHVTALVREEKAKLARRE